MELKLFMLLLGCEPAGRLTEQHDVFFGIATSLKDLVPAINEFWPEADGKIHIDVWKEVNSVDGKLIRILPKDTPKDTLEIDEKIFFLNLGGYKQDDFEEYHYKLLALGKDKAEAINKAKQTAFYKHTGFKGATSHIDEKYGIDVDDIHQIADILPAKIKEQYRIAVTSIEKEPDPINAGYLKINKLIDNDTM